MNRLVKSVKIRNANYSGRNGSATARFAQRSTILFADQMGSLINLFVSWNGQTASLGRESNSSILANARKEKKQRKRARMSASLAHIVSEDGASVISIAKISIDQSAAITILSSRTSVLLGKIFPFFLTVLFFNQINFFFRQFECEIQQPVHIAKDGHCPGTPRSITPRYIIYHSVFFSNIFIRKAAEMPILIFEYILCGSRGQKSTDHEINGLAQSRQKSSWIGLKASRFGIACAISAVFKSFKDVLNAIKQISCDLFRYFGKEYQRASNCDFFHHLF